MRPFKKVGVTVEDIAKRLIDYGFHAPTMSWPVTGTLMIEPTESESKAELDRFCDAMISIRDRDPGGRVRHGRRDDNVLKNAPHTLAEVCGGRVGRTPTRATQAAFPSPRRATTSSGRRVGRVDNAFGDRNLVCSCPPMEDYA